MTKVNRVRWGVLSTAKIGMTQVVPAMRECPSVEIVGVASRHESGAAEAARALGGARGYGSYEALLADPGIDAVYIPLPNHLHVPWTIKALEAGKHVLCEKPVAMNEQEAEQLLAVTKKYPQLKVMEAFMYRFHPQWLKAKEIIDSGAIGVPQQIQSFFSYFNTDPKNIRNIAAYGGGAMMDIGCYCVSLSRFIFGIEPDQVFGAVDRDPVFGTDRHFHGIMKFGEQTSTFSCSTQLEWHQRVVVLGEKGSVEIMIPFNPPVDVPTIVKVREQGEQRVVSIPVSNHYAIQGELFSQAILNESPVPTPLEDGVANMHVMERLMRSAEGATCFDR